MQRLMLRDGLSFDQARAIVEASQGAALSATALERLRVVVAPRPRRRFSGDDALCAVIDPAAASDCTVVAAETSALAAHASTALSSALAGLSPLDRTMLTLRFREGLELSAIGRRLALDGKVLYRRFARLLGALRRALERAGLRGCDVNAALGSESFGLAVCLRAGSAIEDVPRPTAPNV